MKKIWALFLICGLTFTNLTIATAQDTDENNINSEVDAETNFNNEEAWQELCHLISQNGTDKDGMKVLSKESGEYHSDIGVIEGDENTIYLYTKGEYGTEGSEVVAELQIALKKDSTQAEFKATNDIEINISGVESYTKESGYGKLDISTVTGRTKLTLDQYHNETKDIQGNIKESTDVADSTMSGSMQKSLRSLLEDATEILKDSGTNVTLSSLGFYTGLKQDIQLGENEEIRNICADIYAVFPSNWEKSGDDASYNLYPQGSGEIKESLIQCSVSDLGADSASLSYDDKEQTLDKFFDSFDQSIYQTVNEEKNIEIAGFQGRHVEMLLTGNDSKFNITIDVFLADDSIVALGYMHKEGTEDCTDVYQRIIDTIYVDPDGSGNN